MLQDAVKMKKIIIMFALFALLVCSTAYADNLFVRANSNSLWINQVNGVIATPYEWCGLVNQEYEECTPQPDLVQYQDPRIETGIEEICTEAWTETKYTDEVCAKIIVGYTKGKGNTQIPVYNISCIPPQAYTIEHAQECVNSTKTVVIPQEPLITPQAPVCTMQTHVINTCETRYTYSNNATQKEVQKVWQSQTDGSFITEFESSVMAENIYTQSKTPKANTKKLKSFGNATQYYTKNTHPAYKSLSVAQSSPVGVLNMEDRIVSCEEGLIEQAQINKCLMIANNFNQLRTCITQVMQ
jgi:uncharacterized Fe-S cluster protein YjdI